MDDDELAKEMNLTVEQVRRLTPHRRVLAEHMIAVAAALNRGERPPGVLVDDSRKRRRRRRRHG